MQTKHTRRSLEAALPELSEEDVLALLEIEQMQYKRPFFISRLHQRYCNLRATRERLALLAEVK